MRRSSLTSLLYAVAELRGSATSAKYNAEDPNKGHDHTFFLQHSRDVFAY
jgi:hypothetical protein